MTSYPISYRRQTLMNRILLWISILKWKIGFSPQSALKIAWNSEIETIGNYKKIMNNLALYSERADYDDVMYLLNKLIADEEHHIKLIKEAMGVDKGTKGVTVIIK